jgi:hypothetical protein
MNNQIQVILHEGGFRFEMGYVPVIAFTDVELLRFSEMIVMECVKVAMKAVSDDEPKEAWYLIKEHFGVEK